jgi:ribosomal protein S8
MKITWIKILVQLKNASLAKREKILLEISRSSFDLLKTLDKEGLITLHINDTVPVFNNKNLIPITVYLNYGLQNSLLRNLKLISKPSKVVHFSYKDLFKLSDKKTLFFLSTNAGIKTSVDCKNLGIGGILLFKV